MVSLTKNAENTPATATMAESSVLGRCACSMARAATTIIMPNNSTSIE